MSKTIKSETSSDKLQREVNKFKKKYEERKEQNQRLKHIIRELEKEKEKLIEKLKAYESGIEYVPKDISKPKKLTPKEKEEKKKFEEENKKKDFIKGLKEKYGRKE